MSALPPSADTTAGPLAPEEDSAITALQRAMIGPLNAEHYLPVFARFEADDRVGPGWNWAAALCTLNWMLFRRLWGPALMYLGCIAAGALLVFGVGRLMLHLSPSEELSLLVSLGTIAVLVPGGLGDAWLYRQYRARSAKALAAAPTLQEACALLARQASSRQRLLWIGIGNVLLAAAIGSAWLAWSHRSRMPLSAPTSAVEPARSAGGLVTPEPATSMASSAPQTAPPAPAPAASAVAAPASEPVEPASGPTSTASAAVPEAPASAVGPAASPSAVPAAAVPNPSWYPPPAAMAAYVPRRSAPPPVESATAVHPAPQASAATPQGPRIAAKRPVPSAAASASPTVPPSAPPNGGRYVINIGLYAQPANAERVLATLREAGVRTLVQELDMPNGLRTRVRAGPYATRAQADAAAARIRALQLEAVVARE